MTSKQEDQLLVDYYKEGDTIKVDCRWLQEKLRAANNGGREMQKQLDKALRKIERLSNTLHYLEDAMPTYSLDLRG